MKRVLFLILFLIAGKSLAQSQSDDFSYAVKLYNQKFYDLAAQQFVKYYNDYPQSPKNDEAKYYAGMSLFLLENYKQARIEFQSLALEFPKSSRAGGSWYKIGESYEKLGNKEEAVKAYETIRILYPEHVFASKGLYKAGSLLIELGDYEGALGSFNIILDRYPVSHEYFPAMAKAAVSHYRKGNIEQARNFIDKIMASEVDAATMAETLLISGRIYIDLGHYQEASRELMKLINTYEKSVLFPEAIIEYSDLSVRTGNYEDAQLYLKKALGKNLTEEQKRAIRFRLADVYYLNGNYALADKEFEQLQMPACDSTYISVQLKQALSKRKQHLDKKAEEILAGVLESCPEMKSPYQQLVLNIYLDWLEESGDFERATSEINKTLYMVPDLSNRIELVTRLVNYYSRLGKWREIIREAQSLVRLQNNFREKDDLIYHLALAYENIQDFDNAAYYYQKIANEFASSAFYLKSKNRLEYITDYKIVDQDKALARITELFGQSLKGGDKKLLQYELGKIYYSELKEYQRAAETFRDVLPGLSGRQGDVHLYYGKTYLKLAYREAGQDEADRPLLKKAKEQMAKAVENLATCSAPDEASWRLVQTSVMLDTIPLAKEKTYIEKLITTYPESAFLEDWYSELAFSLAYDTMYTTASESYFSELEKRFTNSSRYPTYLFGYGKLIHYKSPEKAINLFKKIASEYPFASEAAQAMYEVARYYEAKGLNRDTNQLYETLINYYYYSDLARKAQQQLRRVKLRAGLYEEAIASIRGTLQTFLLTDPVLGPEFILPEQYDDVYFLARALDAVGETDEARHYYNLYLRTSINGRFIDQTRLALGEYYYETDQRQAALDHFRQIPEKDSALYIKALDYIASIYFDQNNYSAAAGQYQKIRILTTGKSAVAEAFARQITCEIREGKLSLSETHIKEFKRNFENTDNYLAKFTIELGEYFRNSKQFDKAVNYFKTVKKKYSKTAYADDADYLQALTNITLNKTEDALKVLSRFPSDYPDSDRLPAVYNTLGTIYFRSEKYDACISTFKKALELTDDSGMEQQIMSNLIKAYTMTGFWDAAQGLSRTYVENYPFADDVIDKKIIIAQAFINLNQFQNGVEYLKKIKIEADSEREPEIQFYIGEALLKAGQYENAIAEFVKIPLLSKKTKLQWEASALYYAGQAYEKLGRIKDAIRMYQEIVNRPGIDLILKKDASKRIKQIEG